MGRVFGNEPIRDKEIHRDRDSAGHGWTNAGSWCARDTSYFEDLIYRKLLLPLGGSKAVHLYSLY